MGKAIIGEAVVSAQAMAEGEKTAIREGDGTAAVYMQTAAENIASIIRDLIEAESLPHQVLLLCAKGNNSGDAYAAGCLLLEAGIAVTAYQFVTLDQCSALTQHHAARFLETQGHFVEVGGCHHLNIPADVLIVDGLYGTGFQGTIEGVIAEAITKVNAMKNPLLSIDIPSGVSGDDGKVSGPAIQADWTIALGQYKVGHFLDRGYEHVGVLYKVDFGMSKACLDAIEAFAHIVHPAVAQYLPQRERKAHKYSVGEVVVVGGGMGMSGAGVLASYAALRSGAGIVRWYYPASCKEVIQVPYEVICLPYEKVEDIQQELLRAKALLLGPGMGRSAKVPIILNALLKGVEVPVVLDADALHYFSELQLDRAQVILTPHAGELAHLLGSEESLGECERLCRAQAFAEEHKVVIVCKGAPTVVITPRREKIIIPYGNPGMATAGAGDVLAGIISSLLAQGTELHIAAVLGCVIHGSAGDRAKEIYSDRALVASDLIDSLPEVFKSLEK